MIAINYITVYAGRFQFLVAGEITAVMAVMLSITQARKKTIGYTRWMGLSINKP
jgi:hypothetical protein